MTEYRFDHVAVVPAGRVVIRVRNAGALPHSMVLVQLAEDMPPIDEQLHSDTRRAVPTLAQVTPRPPGSSDSVAVELKPGRYGFVCFVKDPDGIAHSLKGMSSEFHVR
jgi:hypothetical protein